MNVFTPKARKEIRKIAASCDNYQIICGLRGDDQPTIALVGLDPAGTRLQFVTDIDPGWVLDAQCLDQFVAQVVDEVREVTGPISDYVYHDRRTLLSRTFIQGTVLPFAEKLESK
jgi:hypothetical protein